MSRFGIASRQLGKNFDLKLYLIHLRAEGRGEDTLMIVSPKDSSYLEFYPHWFEIDGEPHLYIDKRDVFDHPVKTVNEWCIEKGI